MKPNRSEELLDAADGMTIEQAVAYLKHSAEMVNLLCEIRPFTKADANRIKESLTKLEADNG